MQSDEHVMAEAIGRLTEERNRLHQELDKAEARMRYQSRAGAVLKIARTLLAASIIGPLGWLTVQAVAAPDEASHCYVKEQAEPNGKFAGFSLVGHVNLGPDILHGTFPRLQDAVWAAKELHCPLRR